MNANIWQGQKVRLRAVEPEDWQEYMLWHQDTEADRRSYFIPFPVSKEWMKNRLAKDAVAEPKNDLYHFQIETLEGELVGAINSTNCDLRHGRFGYGLGIKRDTRRKGYASEAIILLLNFFFFERRYQKVTVTVYSFNESSIKLHEKLGFQQEGRLRRMIYTDGQYHDELIFGMTIEEFKALHGNHK